MDKYLRSSKINLTISKEQCGKDLVGMVVRSGLSLFSFSGPPFKSTLGAIASTLRVSLHRDNIRQLIINEATKKVNELKKILEEKSVFIKVGSCTRHNRIYFGVNVQFWNGFVDSSSDTGCQILLWETQKSSNKNSHPRSFNQFLNKKIATSRSGVWQCSEYVKNCQVS